MSAAPIPAVVLKASSARDAPLTSDFSARPLRARIGLKQPVLDEAVPMRGRLMHGKTGDRFQAYGMDDSQVINSIPRGWLNCFLLDQAEAFDNVSLFFDHRLQSVDLLKKQMNLIDTTANKERQVFYDVLLGTDGSASAARTALREAGRLEESSQPLSHGYKEFVMTAKDGGGFRMEKNALHIWPRGPFMMIALPNGDGSYTCTLFLSHKTTSECPHSFESLSSDEKIRAFSQRSSRIFANWFPITWSSTTIILPGTWSR